MNSEKGFTLVEIVMVVVILSVLLVVASVRSADLVGTRAGVAANRMREDIRYAQSAASSNNLRTWVVFDVSADIYRLYQGEDRSSRASMTHPLTRNDYVVRLNEGEYAGVQILDADFTGKDELCFDSMGTPYDEMGKPLGANGRVSLTGDVDVVVNPETGVVRVER